jgi:hypothetical protein
MHVEAFVVDREDDVGDEPQVCEFDRIVLSQTRPDG